MDRLDFQAAASLPHQVKLGKPRRLFLAGSTWQLGNPDVTFNTGLLADQDEQAGRTIHIRLSPWPWHGCPRLSFCLQQDFERSGVRDVDSCAFAGIAANAEYAGLTMGLSGICFTRTGRTS